MAIACAAIMLTVAPDRDAAAAGICGQQKVAYHINGEGDERGRGHRRALVSVQNHIDAVADDDIDVVVVVHGPGVGMARQALLDGKLRDRIDNLKAQGVRFEACERSLVSQHIDPSVGLYDFETEDLAPSGVAGHSRLQMMGFTCIKP
jgi:intracellular sulfur oxidation DsrE/DsrF family protein